MRDQVHYNEWGVRIIAKGMKKSLFSIANIGNSKLANLNRLKKEAGPLGKIQPTEATTDSKKVEPIVPPTGPLETTKSAEIDLTAENEIDLPTESFDPAKVNQHVDKRPADDYNPSLLAQLS